MQSRQYLETTWYDPRVEFRPSFIAGGGAFATAPIASGEVVSVAGGVCMSQSEFETYLETVERWNAMQIGEGLHLVDLVQRPEITEGSINHSCDSNLWLADEVTLVARAPIAAGEELTLDYALTTVAPGWSLDLPCNCGTSVCRGTITGDDWRLPHVQQRYARHFAPFINSRIASSQGRAG